MLCARPGARISSLAELKKVPLMADVDFDAVLQKKVKPPFTPPVSPRRPLHGHVSNNEGQCIIINELYYLLSCRETTSTATRPTSWRR